MRLISRSSSFLFVKTIISLVVIREVPPLFCTRKEIARVRYGSERNNLMSLSVKEECCSTGHLLGATVEETSSIVPIAKPGKYWLRGR